MSISTGRSRGPWTRALLLQINLVVWTSGVLSAGDHVLEVEVTGETTCSLSWVFIDAFEVKCIQPGCSGSRPWGRVQESAPARIAYKGDWIQSDTARAFSGGTAAVFASVWGDPSNPDSQKVIFSFTGTQVQWIGMRTPDGGKADVYLDGAFQGTLDLCHPEEQFPVVIWTSAVLVSGPHALEIKRAGANCGLNWVVVDAFETKH